MDRSGVWPLINGNIELEFGHCNMDTFFHVVRQQC